MPSGSTNAVDYDLAVATARRLAPAPPAVSWAEAGEAVAELRRLAVSAEEHVRAVTGLTPPGEVLEATVVDRPGWSQANVEGFRVVLEPLTRRIEDKQPNPLAAAATGQGDRRADGHDAGLALRQGPRAVRGVPPEGEAGRLILVAPNIVETERRLEVDPHDFRLWVTLHEVTHRTQFTAVPWLHDHVPRRGRALLEAGSFDDRRSCSSGCGRS
jgi:coenzyme F420 biosynthesis associated uncharacterized protein